MSPRPILSVTSRLLDAHGSPDRGTWRHPISSRILQELRRLTPRLSHKQVYSLTTSRTYSPKHLCLLDKTAGGRGSSGLSRGIVASSKEAAVARTSVISPSMPLVASHSILAPGERVSRVGTLTTECSRRHQSFRYRRLGGQSATSSVDRATVKPVQLLTGPGGGQR